MLRSRGDSSSSSSSSSSDNDDDANNLITASEAATRAAVDALDSTSHKQCCTAAVSTSIPDVSSSTGSSSAPLVSPPAIAVAATNMIDADGHSNAAVSMVAAAAALEHAVRRNRATPASITPSDNYLHRLWRPVDAAASIVVPLSALVAVPTEAAGACGYITIRNMTLGSREYQFAANVINAVKMQVIDDMLASAGIEYTWAQLEQLVLNNRAASKTAMLKEHQLWQLQGMGLKALVQRA
jgi:hypothetical protein